jgi:hypothetical protein
MRTGIRLCGSGELKVLQQVADSIVDELGHDPAYRTIDKTKLLHRVGKQVFKTCTDGDLLSVDEIKRRVLAKFHH